MSLLELIDVVEEEFVCIERDELTDSADGVELEEERDDGVPWRRLILGSWGLSKYVFDVVFSLSLSGSSAVFFCRAELGVPSSSSVSISSPPAFPLSSS